jgi:hypothetical protein
MKPEELSLLTDFELRMALATYSSNSLILAQIALLFKAHDAAIPPGVGLELIKMNTELTETASACNNEMQKRGIKDMIPESELSEYGERLRKKANKSYDELKTHIKTIAHELQEKYDFSDLPDDLKDLINEFNTQVKEDTDKIKKQYQPKQKPKTTKTNKTTKTKEQSNLGLNFINRYIRHFGDNS